MNIMITQLAEIVITLSAAGLAIGVYRLLADLDIFEKKEKRRKRK